MTCGCCSPLRARYKRLVDNIFPDYPEEGLVKSNMEKLIYYAATSPEKLDRIGEYLAYRIGRDIYKRNGFVKIGMEAMDQLLMACHAQTLNLYVESYLKTIQKLLESPEPDLQILASDSFLQFSQKEEDMPAYHRRYDFFIDKFSQMCHVQTNDPDITLQIRVSGLQGIGGVVRKTVNEDLAENIWSQTHMDKIIPSLLYNIQIGEYRDGAGRSQTPDLGTVSNEDLQSPMKIAEDTLRKLVGRASFNSIRSVMNPVLRHLDQHKLWSPADFAEHIFQMIMFSIAQNVNYIIIEMLMQHLGKRGEDTLVRCGIATVLSKIFNSGAIDASVGPSVLETINALYTHLRSSVEQTSRRIEPDPDAQRYHEALLTALGEYSSSLPNFQMIEIMMFILSKSPSQVIDQMDPQSMDSELQHMRLKALLTVGEKYVPIQFSTTFPMQFLVPLLNMFRSPDPDVRLLVLKIFQTLIDRKNNLDKLDQPTVDPRSDLVAQKPNFNKQDNIFFGKHGERFYSELLRVIKDETNSLEFLEHVWTTCSLMLLECNSDENISFVLDLMKKIQDVAVNPSTNIRLSLANRFALHAICISLLSTLAFVVRIPEIFEYKDRLVSLRRTVAPHLLPPLEEDYSPDLDPESNLEEVLIDFDPINMALENEGRKFDKQGSQAPRSRQNSPRNSPRNSTWIDSVTVVRRPSSVSVTSIVIDVDSCDSSPGIVRRAPDEQVSFAALKRALAEPTPREKEDAEKEKRQILDKFLTANFTELCDLVAASGPTDSLNQCLVDVFGKPFFNNDGLCLDGSRKGSFGGDIADSTDKMEKPEIYEVYFKEMFMY